MRPKKLLNIRHFETVDIEQSTTHTLQQKLRKMSSSDQYQQSGTLSRQPSKLSRQPSRLSYTGEYDEDEEKGSVILVSPEKREWIRNESEAILAKNLMLRERTKQEMFEKRIAHERLMQVARESRDSRWKSKTKHSPFAVNLVAEDERITEENTIRLKEENERRFTMEARKQKAKNEIILKALSEFSDLEALRREKRAIMDEEQRLKALLSLEKVTVTGKADRMIAERAQRQRKEAKLSHRRQLYKDSLDQVIEEERQALMRKHGHTGHSAESHTRPGTHLTSHSRASTGTNGGAMTPAALAAMTNMSMY